jgi:hypothetical protein
MTSASLPKIESKPAGPDVVTGLRSLQRQVTASPTTNFSNLLVGKRLDGPHSGSRADLIVIWDRLIMSGGNLGKWMRAAGERIEGSAY